MDITGELTINSFLLLCCTFVCWSFFNWNYKQRVYPAISDYEYHIYKRSYPKLDELRWSCMWARNCCTDLWRQLKRSGWEGWRRKWCFTIIKMSILSRWSHAENGWLLSLLLLPTRKCVTTCPIPWVFC